MRITSFGAARDVTGSKHLIEINGHKILFDCGMFQGRREETFRKNKELPFDGGRLSAVVVSHAHIDHTGTLPILARHNFRGRIYATPATRDLCSVMLLDSAHIQERDARWLSKKHQTFVPPIYAEADVMEIMRHFVDIPYDMPFDVAPGVRITFKDAGHVLGSAMVHTEIEENGTKKVFLFSGDIGRKNMPILRDPWEPNEADVVMMESTYGNRDHGPIETLEDDLAQIINRTYARGGKIIVPSFAFERAQEFIYALKLLEAKNKIPSMQVFVDSPMTVNITDVFRLHSDLFDDRTRELMMGVGDPFLLKRIKYVHSVEESMEINEIQEPIIIISASGMCEYGRILHHLRNNCTDERNTILIIGFQAKHTLGRRIVERDKDIKIFGVKQPLRAEVKVLNSLSAHAGRAELIAFGERFKNSADKILLVHGEDEALQALQKGLQEVGCRNVIIQQEGVPVEM